MIDLATVEIFAGCSARELEMIAAELEGVEMPAGAVLFEEGDPGDELFLIESGEVSITSGSEEHHVVLATLGAGACFGEMAVLTGAPRSATATCVSNVKLLRLQGQAYRHLADIVPALPFALRRLMAERTSRSAN
jgi:CRP/FNR family cyclic AMP-dependent transcriptional regulator